MKLVQKIKIVWEYFEKYNPHSDIKNTKNLDFVKKKNIMYGLVEVEKC